MSGIGDSLVDSRQVSNRGTQTRAPKDGSIEDTRSIRAALKSNGDGNLINVAQAGLISGTASSERSEWINGALAGAACMKNWRALLEIQKSSYGIQQFYGEASVYARLDIRSKREKINEWNRNKRAIPTKWKHDLHYPLQPDKNRAGLPDQKGCYGWAKIHIEEVYLKSGHNSLWDEIKGSGFPTQLAAGMSRHGWEVIYYAARRNNLPASEITEAQTKRLYSRHRVPIDDTIVDFASAGGTSRVENAIKMQKLQKLKSIPFYFAIEAFVCRNRLGQYVWMQGCHSWVGTNNSVCEFVWTKNPYEQPIASPTLESMLAKSGGRGQGLILVPPGMWPIIRI
jgi:hypothetical protein